MAIEAAVDPETTEPEAVVDPGIDPAVAPGPDPGEPPPAPEPAPRKDHWALRRISEESEKARQAQERASAAERRAQQAEELAERLRNGQAAPPAPAPRVEPQGDRQAEIRAEAARQRLYEDSSEVVSRGVAEYGPAFAETQRALAALGAATDDFVLDVMAVDRNNAHKLFKEIADDPERAIALAGMSSRQRLVELGKMTVKAAPVSPIAPASTSASTSALAPARRVSAAPAPAPHVTPSAAPAAKDGYDDASSDADFDKQFFGRWKERSARR